MFDFSAFDITAFARDASTLLELIGVVAILGGAALSTLVAAATIFRKNGVHHIYRSFRNNLARSILIGLEFLIASDVIHTVAGNLDTESVLVLGAIVVIRLVLGLEFEMEIEGRWPWQKGKRSTL